VTVWTWKFFDALVVSESGLSDVLKEVNYVIRGTRGEGEDAKFYEIGGRTSLGAPDPATFVPFASLTADQMVFIVGTSVNIEALKTQINAWHDKASQIKPLPFEVAS
jgi:hypothetical protein